MAQTLTHPIGWETNVALATPHTTVGDVAGLHRLPSEWQTVDRVVLDDAIIDHVVVGPNGVFAIAIDPDSRPAEVRSDGIYRDDARVTTAVKSALKAAFDLRQRVDDRLFAYPMLVTSIDATEVHLDRLGVIPGGQIAEAIWCHPGRPMIRSQRVEALWTLRSLTR
jgi:hypothetical protein